MLFIIYSAQNTGFSLGWEVADQKNGFQVKREQKNQNMATKVTDQMPSSKQIESVNFEDKCFYHHYLRQTDHQ